MFTHPAGSCRDGKATVADPGVVLWPSAFSNQTVQSTRYCPSAWCLRVTVPLAAIGRPGKSIPRYWQESRFRVPKGPIHPVINWPRKALFSAP